MIYRDDVTHAILLLAGAPPRSYHIPAEQQRVLSERDRDEIVRVLLALRDSVPAENDVWTTNPGPDFLSSR